MNSITHREGARHASPVPAVPFSGVTVGATALAALGFTLIYNASNVINFARVNSSCSAACSPWCSPGRPATARRLMLAIIVPAIVGVLIEKLAIEPVKGAETVTLIIITIGASLVIRGLVAVFLGKNTHSLPPFSGDAPIEILGATLLPQSLWVLGVTALVVVALWYFFNRTLQGKAMLATSVGSAGRRAGRHQHRLGAVRELRHVGRPRRAGRHPAHPDHHDLLRCRHHARPQGLRRCRAGSLATARRRGRRPAGRYPGSDGRRLHFVGLQGRDSFVLILLILFFMHPRGLFGAKVTDRV
jgi:branched-chain amino acid transport system permease protein